MLEPHRAHGRIALPRLAAATLAGLGLPSARAESLRNLARVVARREIDLEPGVDPTAIVAKLVELPGIGPWTAEYIAMRALRWPDAFPAGDLGLLKASRLKSAKALEKAAERWRPWRAYAAMHLWESLEDTFQVELSNSLGVTNDDHDHLLQLHRLRRWADCSSAVTDNS